MNLRKLNYNINTDGISPGVEQFAGTQGDHRVTRLNFVLSDKFHQEIDELQAEGDKVMYRFDVYDGEGGIWSSDCSELLESSVGIELEERHTRFGGKITVYLVITLLSKENETQVELYSFPAILRLKNRPEGEYQEGENYESVSSLAETTKQKAVEATISAMAAEKSKKELQNIATEIEEKLLNGEFDGKDGVSVTHSFDGTVLKMTSASGTTEVDLKGEKGERGLKGEKGDKGDTPSLEDYYTKNEADNHFANFDNRINDAVNYTIRIEKRFEENYYTKGEVDNIDAVKYVIQDNETSVSLNSPAGNSYIQVNDNGDIDISSEENICVLGSRIIHVGNPVDTADAATKGYVDDVVANAGGVGSADLTDYVKNTDYATDKVAGVVKLHTDYGIRSIDGSVASVSRTIEQYNTMSNYAFISKGTLENVLADKIHNYELIEEIAVTEDVSEILKTTSPDGTPYNFKAVTIEFSSEGVTGYSGKQLIEFNDGRVFKGNAEFLSDNRASIIRGIYCGGLTFYDATWNAPSANNATINQNGYAIVPKTAQENVTKIHIRSAVKAGTVIKIYGIRA